jgi:uncharacterized membrane protein HdeD (DUF308 family)
MEKPTSRFALIIPGVILIILGVTVLIEPRILAWLVAIALIVMGIAMLMLTRFVRRVGEQFKGNHG